MSGLPSSKPFRVEEATIDDLHEAIKAGRTTCVDVVRQYIARARAFNGVATQLVTADGAPAPERPGTMRAGAPLKFPTATVKASRRSCPISTTIRARRSNMAGWSRPRPIRTCSSSSA